MAKALNYIKRTRFKLTIYMGLLLFVALFWAIGTHQSDVASALCIPIGLLLSFYMYGETSRPSTPENKINENNELH